MLCCPCLSMMLNLVSGQTTVVTSLDRAGEFADELISASGDEAHRLLQHLVRVQQTYSFIPEAARDTLASRLGITPAVIDGVISFYSFLHSSPRGDYDILFSDNITDRMAGSQLLIKQLNDRLGIRLGGTTSNGVVSIDTTSCTGMCDQGPAMLVNGITLTRLDETRIESIAELIEQRTPVEEWPTDFFKVEDHIQCSDLLLDTRLARGEALQSLQTNGATSTLESIKAASLRGRGGAGFDTALKWSLCKQTDADERYVVCNADEGEPGTFKDRVLLQSRAEELLEGMTLCAGIIGASKGLIYLRGEYRYLLDALNETIAVRRADNLLGTKLMGVNGFDFDVEIHLGAGAYICGEESALIESLEGKRGIPRKRPPFPVSQGYLGMPTVVNNVETFIAAAQIAVHGSDWFRSRGTPESSGTKLLSISGDCQRPGIYEIPFGTSIRDILADCGANDTQAVQVAGAAGHMIPPVQFGRTIAYEDIATAGSFMVFNKERDMLAVVQNFSNFFVHESCGFCTPCRVGGKLLDNLVSKLQRGRASNYDIEEIRSIATLMRDASHCGLGATAPNPVIDLLDRFAYSYATHLDDDFGPAFDIDAALGEAREISGRTDNGIIGGDRP